MCLLVYRTHLTSPCFVLACCCIIAFLSPMTFSPVRLFLRSTNALWSSRILIVPCGLSKANKTNAPFRIQADTSRCKLFSKLPNRVNDLHLWFTFCGFSSHHPAATAHRFYYYICFSTQLLAPELNGSSSSHC